jgi:hypothetical protein
MDLKSFVAETLKAVVAGIKEAQADEGGEAINAAMSSQQSVRGHLISTQKDGLYTRIDFDVALSTETSGWGKGKLTIWPGVGLEAGGDHKAGNLNRISFSVPVPRGYRRM